MAESTDGQIEVSDRSELGRYEIRVDGEVAGISEYRLQPGEINFIHTEVSGAYKGQGLAGRLVEFAVTDARARGLRIIPSCSFVRKWISEHPEES